MLLQIKSVISINQARNQPSPFLEVPFTRFSVTQRVENNYPQLENVQDKPRSRWSLRELSSSVWEQANKNPDLHYFVVWEKASLAQQGGRCIPCVIPHLGWFLVTAKLIGLKTLQTASNWEYQTWEWGFVAAADSLMTCFCRGFGCPCPSLLPGILELAFPFITSGIIPPLLVLPTPLPGSGLQCFPGSIAPVCFVTESFRCLCTAPSWQPCKLMAMPRWCLRF